MWFVIPSVSLAAILLNVFVSAKVRTFQAAYQLGGLVVLPALALIVGQVTGVLLFEWPVIVLIGGALIALDGVLWTLIGRHLERTGLFESQVQ